MAGVVAVVVVVVVAAAVVVQLGRSWKVGSGSSG